MQANGQMQRVSIWNARWTLEESDDCSMLQYSGDSPPPSFTFGNVGRTSRIRALGFPNYNLPLFKTFRIRERVKAAFWGRVLQMRSHVQLDGPNTTAGSNTFGQISTQANTPRQGQVALKLRF